MMMKVPRRTEFNQNVKAPCLDCNDRKVGCHGKCDDYKGFRSGLDNTNKIIRETKERSYIYIKSMR